MLIAATALGDDQFGTSPLGVVHDVICVFLNLQNRVRNQLYNDQQNWTSKTDEYDALNERTAST